MSQAKTTRVAVTGGTGKLGRAVVQELLDHGHDVVNLDRVPDVSAPTSAARAQRFPSFDADPALRQWNLWGYIDARDAAQAVRLALSYPERGLSVFLIANADTVMSRASADLATAVFPDVPVRRGLAPHETLLSIDKARQMLGYEPRHSWRGHAG